MLNKKYVHRAKKRLVNFHKKNRFLSYTLMGVIALVMTSFVTAGVYSAHADGIIVTIIDPTAGATVSSTSVALTATVSDGTADFVSFLIDGGSSAFVPATYDSESGNWRATLDSTIIPDGSHSLIVDAFSLSDFTDHFSPIISFTSDNHLPVMTDPQNNATIAGSSVQLAASVPEVTADSLEFVYTAGRDEASIPATYDSGSGLWKAVFDSTTVSDGPFGIRARASINGETRTGRGVNLTVQNVPTPVFVHPTDGETVSGATSTLAVTAAGAYTGVQFDVDFSQFIDAAYDSGSNTWKANWDTTSLSEGYHYIGAVASIGGSVGVRQAVSANVHNVNVAFSNQVDGGTISTSTIISVLVQDVQGHPVTASAVSINGIPATFNVTAGTWDFDILQDLGSFQNGAVQISAIATVNGVDVSASPINVTVSIPVLTFESVSPLNNQIVSGTVPFLATVTGGVPDSVTVQVRQQPFGSTTSVQMTRNGLTGNWAGLLDTTSLPNGVYELEYRATKVGYRDAVRSQNRQFGDPDTNSYLIQTQNLTLVGHVSAPLANATVDGIITLAAVVSPEAPTAVTFRVVLNNGQVPVATLVGQPAEPPGPPGPPGPPPPGPGPGSGPESNLWTATLDTSGLADGTYIVYLDATKDGFAPLRAASAFGVRVVAFSDSLFRAAVPKGGKGTSITVPSFARVAPKSGVTLFGSVPLSGSVSQTPKSVKYDVYDISNRVDSVTTTRADDTGNWTAIWDTTHVPNGTYYIQPSVLTLDDVSFEQTPWTVVVNNLPRGSLEVSIVSPTSSGQTLPRSFTLSATTHQPVSSLNFHLIGSVTSTELAASSTDSSLEHWSLVWDSSTLPDGPYTLIAVASSTTDVGQSSSVTFVLHNSTQKDKPLATVKEVQEGEYSPEDAKEVAKSIDQELGLPSIAYNDHAKYCSPGTLIKGMSSTLYYCGVDIQRHAFPNAKIFQSWYESTKPTIRILGDAIVNSVPQGVDVGYRPGSRMLKVTTDPKTYAIAPSRILRWVVDESTAVRLYGEKWNQMIDDVSSAFMSLFTIGADIK